MCFWILFATFETHSIILSNSDCRNGESVSTKEVSVMKSLTRSAIFRALTGTSLGMLVGVLLCQRLDISPIITILSSGIYGAAVMGAIVVYDIEPWSLTRSTLWHLAVTLVGFCLVGLIQGWLSRVPIWMLVVFLIVYLVIWMIQWMICYLWVYKMNEFIRRRRNQKVN